jgi:predicted nucleotidyltransferase
MLNSAVSLDHEAIADACRRFGVATLRIFGSALRQDFDPSKSDIDLLVEFEPGVSKGLFTLVALEDALTRIFGRKVDLLTPAGISKYFRDDVLKSAELLYDAA